MDGRPVTGPERDEDGRVEVVLGAGPLGTAVSARLVRAGHRVRVVTRSPVHPQPGIEHVTADLTDQSAAVRACHDASVIYHCASPPYADWPRQHPPMMAAVIAAGEATGATVVFGDNLYAYGPQDAPLVERMPYAASGPNGRTRGRIARMLLDAHHAGRVRAVIGRGSDFFGPHVGQSAVGDRVFAPLLAGKPAQLLGDPDAPHAVTFIEDFAGALIDLGAQPQALGRAWHVPNAPAVSLRRFVELVAAAADADARVRTAPSWVLAVAGLVHPTVRAVREQLYQFERPWLVDSSDFEATFGWRATPLEDAIARTVSWYRGCDARPAAPR
jgi:nucleoside-diphosphate-sugar epimerase